MPLYLQLAVVSKSLPIPMPIHLHLARFYYTQAHCDTPRVHCDTPRYASFIIHQDIDIISIISIIYHTYLTNQIHRREADVQRRGRRKEWKREERWGEQRPGWRWRRVVKHTWLLDHASGCLNRCFRSREWPTSHDASDALHCQRVSTLHCQRVSLHAMHQRVSTAPCQRVSTAKPLNRYSTSSTYSTPSSFSGHSGVLELILLKSGCGGVGAIRLPRHAYGWLRLRTYGKTCSNVWRV